MRYKALGLLSAVALLAGCASAMRPVRDARVVGKYESCGGPAPGHCYPLEGSVLVLNPRGQVIAGQRIVRGRFSFRLVPGSYTLVPDKPDRLPRQSVRAVAHQTRTVNIDLAIP